MGLNQAQALLVILACANGAGQAIPPMVIFDLKNFQQPLTEGEVSSMCF